MIRSLKTNKVLKIKSLGAKSTEHQNFLQIMIN